MNSCGVPNASDRRPTDFNMRWMAPRTCGSSSTTNTVAATSTIMVRGSGHCDQRESEGRAAARVGGCPEPTTMRFDNGATDRQAHPRPLCFGREERLENPILMFWRQSD